jgi:hypothetical protein
MYAWAIIMQTHGSETGHDEFCRSGNDLFCVDLEELSCFGGSSHAEPEIHRITYYITTVFLSLYKSNYEYVTSWEYRTSVEISEEQLLLSVQYSCGRLRACMTD